MNWLERRVLRLRRWARYQLREALLWPGAFSAGLGLYLILAMQETLQRRRWR